ncbi:hypothetical protein ACJMK2_014153 [Sinanodonta woodiana]|uniref:Uncharacterized protein n=1 Tax=Sinanodonta woodiana TaxID=1069815 RepID=A0ABD3V2A3_SINWO
MDGNKSVMLDKWRSIVNHIHNKHDGHGDLFPTCLHNKLVGCENKKKWLKPGSAAVARFCDLVHSRQVTKYIQQLSPLNQTSELECLHSVLNHFAPKLIGFSYYGTICRAFLAALHFEENSRKPQANGQLRYQISFPKYKCGEYSVKEVKVENTYCYVDSLMDLVEVFAENIKMNDKSGL